MQEITNFKLHKLLYENNHVFVNIVMEFGKSFFSLDLEIHFLVFLSILRKNLNI